jgi:hypothetical protein
MCGAPIKSKGVMQMVGVWFMFTGTKAPLHTHCENPLWFVGELG